MQRRVKYWNPERHWGYKPFVRSWRKRAPMFWIMPFELAGTVALLVLFAIAQPDLFRTQLWQVGSVWGFNSDPNIIVWAKANHRPAPNVPFVWTERLTDYNVAISVLSLFVLLVKLVAFIMRAWTPIIGLFFSLAMTVLYTVSVYGQMGPDFYDPAHPSPIAWYIRYGCWPAVNFPNNAVGSCRMAVGTYAATWYLLFIYLLLLGYAIHSMIPTADEKEAMRSGKAVRSRKAGEGYGDDDDDASLSESGERHPAVMTSTNDKVVFEMIPPSRQHILQQNQSQPQPPPSLFTPRTQAFHSLERKLPLRGE